MVAVIAAVTSTHAAGVTATDTESLVAAVAGAAPGDVITLAPGTYAPLETIYLRRAVTLRGPSTAPGARLIASAVDKGAGAGAVLSIDSGVEATVSSLTISQGALDGTLIDVFGSLTLDHSTVQGNLGSVIVAQSGSRLDVVNTTISDNSDFGIVAQGGSAVRVASSTIAGNLQGGIFNDFGSRLTLQNTILANTIDCQNRATSSVATIEGAAGSCGANIQADARVDRLAQNGGPTTTRALLPGSPAIDAGDTATCATDDQRYSARVGRCDIGAFESGGTPGTAPPSDPPAGDTPTCATSNGRRDAVTLSARGTIGVAPGRRASFRIALRRGTQVTRGTYVDRRSGRRVTLLRLLAIDAPRSSRNVTLRGVSRDNRSGRLGCFTIRIKDAQTDEFSIRLSDGYRRAGRVTGGGVAIARSAKTGKRGRTVTAL